LGVAFYGKPLLREQVPAQVNHNDLTALLFFQGYRSDEFVTG
jgi:phosphoserine phosphatase